MHSGPSKAAQGKCVYPGCVNTAAKYRAWADLPCHAHTQTGSNCECKPPFTLFNFPRKQNVYRNEWIRIVSPNPLWEPKRYSLVCSEHFEDGEPTKDNPCPKKNYCQNEGDLMQNKEKINQPPREKFLESGLSHSGTSTAMEWNSVLVKTEPEEEWQEHESMDTSAAMELESQLPPETSRNSVWNFSNVATEVKQEICEADDIEQQLLGQKGSSSVPHPLTTSGSFDAMQQITPLDRGLHFKRAEKVTCPDCGKAVSANRGLARHKCKMRNNLDSPRKKAKTMPTTVTVSGFPFSIPGSTALPGSDSVVQHSPEGGNYTPDLLAPDVTIHEHGGAQIQLQPSHPEDPGKSGQSRYILDEVKEKNDDAGSSMVESGEHGAIMDFKEGTLVVKNRKEQSEGSLKARPPFQCQLCCLELESPRLYVSHHLHNCLKSGPAHHEPLKCSLCLNTFNNREVFVNHFHSSCSSLLTSLADLSGLPSSVTTQGENNPGLPVPGLTTHKPDNVLIKLEPDDLGEGEDANGYIAGGIKEERIDETDDAGSSVRESSGNELNQARDLRCTLCNKVFLLEENIEIHLRSDCPEVPFEARQSSICPRCGKQLCNVKSLLRHMQYSCPNVAIKKEGSPVTCPSCGKTFTSQFCKDVLRKHIRLCGKEVPYNEVQCTQCDRKFQGIYCKDLLRRHIMRCHTAPEAKADRFMTVICELCGQEYSGNYSRDVLRKHMQLSCPARDESSKQKFFSSSQCEYCGKVFSGIYGKCLVRKHVRSCILKSSKPLVDKTQLSVACPICGKIFSGVRCKDSLRVHRRKCENSQRNLGYSKTVTCQICLRVFKGDNCDSALSKHLRVCSNMEYSGLYNVLDYEVTECKACKRVFSGKSCYQSVKRHIKVCSATSEFKTRLTSDSEGACDDTNPSSSNYNQEGMSISTGMLDISQENEEVATSASEEEDYASLNADATTDVLRSGLIDSSDIDNFTDTDKIGECSTDNSRVSVNVVSLSSEANEIIASGGELISSVGTSLSKCTELKGQPSAEETTSASSQPHTEREANESSVTVENSGVSKMCEKCSVNFNPLRYELHKLTSPCWNEANFCCPRCDIKCLSEQGLRWHLRSNKCMQMSSVGS